MIEAGRAVTPRMELVAGTGGDTVRELQLYLSPTAEHLLDWWHVAMRITGMQQLVPGARAAADGDDLCNLSADLERVKWYVWHGNVFRALQVLDDLQLDLGMCQAY